jgi:hypothetical protein
MRLKWNLLNWVQQKGSEVVIPNFFHGMFEMDVFLLKSSGYIYEYEIKVSRSDFKADFKKSYNQGEWGDNKKEVFKHDLIAKGEAPCNRFFFVVPEGLITPEECPSHAGLIYYYEQSKKKNWYGFQIVKNAKLLHKRSFDNWKDLCNKLAFRETIHRQKLNNRMWDKATYEDRLYDTMQELRALKTKFDEYKKQNST